MSRAVKSEHWQAGGALGDTLEELYKDGHISGLQYATASKFLHDLRTSRGSSEGVVGVVEERVQSSTRSRIAPPGAHANAAQRRTAHVLKQLRDHERETLHFLIMRREMARGGLSDLGRIRSNYQTQKTTRAAATGLVRALVATIVEVYPSDVSVAA